MSYRIEVRVSGVWSGNALRLATRTEAGAYGLDLITRWTVPDSYRIVESDQPVNYSYVNWQLVPVAAEEAQ